PLTLIATTVWSSNGSTPAACSATALNSRSTTCWAAHSPHLATISSTRRRPNNSPAMFWASRMPSLKNTNRSPGFALKVNSSNSTDQSGVDRRRSSLATNVPYNDRGTRKGIGQEIIQVAANGTSRHELRRHFQVAQLRIGGGEQANLQLASQGEVALQSSFLPGNLFIELGIFNGDGHLGGEGSDRALVIFGEKTASGMLK